MLLTASVVIFLLNRICKNIYVPDLTCCHQTWRTDGPADKKWKRNCKKKEGGCRVPVWMTAKQAQLGRVTLLCYSAFYSWAHTCEHPHSANTRLCGKRLIAATGGLLLQHTLTGKQLPGDRRCSFLLARLPCVLERRRSVCGAWLVCVWIDHPSPCPFLSTLIHRRVD